MAAGTLVILAAAIVTADFCASPIDGGAREPQFCRLASPQVVSTPYFSVTVGPEFLVGIDRAGRRMMLEATLRQSLAGLTIEMLEGAELPAWHDCPALAEIVLDSRGWQDCRLDDGGFVERRIATLAGSGHIVAQYRYGPASRDLAEALERALQSLRVHAN